jgi:uncharacterized membrane protein
LLTGAAGGHSGRVPGPFDLDDIPEVDSGSVLPLDREGSGRGGGPFAPLDREEDDDNPARPVLLALAGVALLGAAFSAVSTSDFIQHLDRQFHAIHCSFIPGAGRETAESGCRTVMMSAYSSVFRESLWGGLPISLLALAVFAYLVHRGVSFGLGTRFTRREGSFLIAATALPVVMSAIYGVLAAVKVEATCKLCVGVYACSAAGFALALIASRRAGEDEGEVGLAGAWTRWFLEGTAYVATLVVLYLSFVPIATRAREGCGTLVKPDDPNGIFVPLARGGSATVKRTPAIELLDPLCPACRAFDERLQAAESLADRLELRAVLFPLDSSCNWMVKESVHPGACAVSEAILCDRDHAREILDFAFQHQDEFRGEAKDGDASLRSRLDQRFPKLKGCLGSAPIRNKLNKSLRWAVANALPLLTPQLFVDKRRVCDEDTDLGLEYTLAGMLRAER